MKLKALSTLGIALSLGLSSLGFGGTASADESPFTRDNFYQLQSAVSPYKVLATDPSKALIGNGLVITGLSNNGNYVEMQDSTDGNFKQNFLMYQLDDGFYAMINKQTGMALDGKSTLGNRVSMGPWSGNASQQWRIVDKYPFDNALQKPTYVFENKATGKVLDQGGGVVTWDRNYGQQQYWGISKKEHINGNIPSLLPTGTLPSAPRFTGFNQLLPEQTEPVVTGSTIIPAIMVTDNNRSDATKVQNSPYYRLVKKQYWKRLEIVNFTPGDEQEVTEKTGMSKQQVDSMVEKTGIEIKADLGLSFGGDKAKGTGALSAKFTKELTTTHSSTETELEETTVRHTLKNPSTTSDFSWAKYALVTEYTLERMDGSKVSDSWTVIDGKVTQNTSWPSGQQPTIQSTKTISVY